MAQKYRRIRNLEPYVTQVLGYGQALSGHGVVTPRTQGVQAIVSEGHPYHLLGKDERDLGGPFENRKVHIELEDWGPRWIRWHNSARYGWQRQVYTIPVPTVEYQQTAHQSNLVDSQAEAHSFLASKVPPAFSVATLNAWGTSVIKSVKPTNPVADLAMSIGEFVSERKFFSLPGTSGSLPGEYLNYMFGIAPTLDDIQDLRRAIEDREALIAQYVRDSGRRVRRRFEPEPERETTRTVEGGKYLSWIGASPGLTAPAPSGTLTTVTNRSQKLWFSGCFTYYLPKEGLRRDLALMDKLYGVVPGSALLWELMPYSWLLDYRLSIGATLSNLDSFLQDGLVMPYAYVMAQQVETTEHTWQGLLADAGGSLVPTTVVGRVRKITQQRVAATPFGFGLLPGSFTARQLSILAALGLTKLDK